MGRSMRSWRYSAVLGAAALTLAACGGGSGGSGGSGGTATDGETPQATVTGDGKLVIGTLLPQTGNLAFLGPPEFAGVNLAVKEINEAGGVNGQDVTSIDSDSGDTSTDIANQSVDRLLSENVDVIVGAASSGVSMTVIDKITGAGVLMISPANTSPDFTDYADDGLYFRTAPSDVLQGRVMGDQLIQDGHTKVGILALDDPYGKGLAENVKKSVEEGGGEVSTEPIIYDPKAANFAAEVTQIKSSDPDAIVLIGFDETKKIIPELQAQQIGPANMPLYFVDGNMADYSGDFPEGTLTGVKGTQPGAEVTDEFKARLASVDDSLTVYNYGPEAYDATILVALAAQAAGEDGGKNIAGQMEEITNGDEQCNTFADCKQLLEDGKTIAYQGVSGPIAFDSNGDRSEATIGVYEYNDTNNYTSVSFESGKL